MKFLLQVGKSFQWAQQRVIKFWWIFSFLKWYNLCYLPWLHLNTLVCARTPCPVLFLACLVLTWRPSSVLTEAENALTLHFSSRCIGSAEYLLPGVIPARWCPDDSDPLAQAGRYSFVRTHAPACLHACLLTPDIPPSLQGLLPQQGQPVQVYSAVIQTTDCLVKPRWLTAHRAWVCTFCWMGWIWSCVTDHLETSMQWWGFNLAGLKVSGIIIYIKV